VITMPEQQYIKFLYEQEGLSIRKAFALHSKYQEIMQAYARTIPFCSVIALL